MTHERNTEIIKAIEESLPALRSFARGLTSHDVMADDIVQSACERALGRLDQVTVISGVKSWLHRIMYTQWQDVLRRRQRRNRQLHAVELQPQTIHPNRTNGEAVHIARLDLRTILERLPEEQKVAVILVSMLGYGYQEASEILDIPAGTVASRVARARVLLAGYLKTGEKPAKKLFSQKEVAQ